MHGNLEFLARPWQPERDRWLGIASGSNWCLWIPCRYRSPECWNALLPNVWKCSNITKRAYLPQFGTARWFLWRLRSSILLRRWWDYTHSVLIAVTFIVSDITSLQYGECGRLGLQYGEWTSWDDRDDPSGQGDYELIHLRSDFKEICKNPSAVQARLTETGNIRIVFIKNNN